MADNTVVTELVVTSDNQGAVDYTQTMAAASAAAAMALAANDNLQNGWRAANDNARDAAEKHSHLGIVFKQVAQAALDAAESYAKQVAATALVVGVLGLLARTLGPIYLAYRLVKAGIDLVSEAWQLGGKQIEEYIDISKKALAVNLSTDFFQRIVASATAAKIPVDDLTAAFKRLNEATADKLGGSEGQKRLDELTKVGNFQGNTGLSQLNAANTTEEKFRSIVSLIDQAMQKGERLAALDVAKTFLGESAATALAKDSDYLNKMLESADKIKADKLISDEDVGNALMLQSRLDAAEKILSQRWHPIQDMLASIGVSMHESWVSIVEAIASSVDWAAKLVEKLALIPTKFWDVIQNGSIWKQIADTTGAMGLNSTPEQMGIQLVTPADIARDNALKAMDAQLRNPANIDRSRDSTNNVIRGVFKDTSIDPNKKKDEGPDTSAYDRAEESLLRYIEVTKAAASAVDDGAAAQERAKAMAQLTAAGIKDGLTPAAAAAKAEMSGLAQQAGNAAEALAKAKVASQIDFNRQTAFLSPEDVQIAQQLHGIYGNNVPRALDSSYAAAIRFNNQMKALNNTALDATKSIAVDFKNGLVAGANAWSAFGTAASSSLNRISDKLLQMEIDNLWSKAFGGSTGGIGNLLGNIFGSSNPLAGSANVYGSAGSLAVPTFATGTDYAPGGWSLVGEQGPELMNVPRGAQILPHGKMPANDNGPTEINISMPIDARGAQEGVAEQIGKTMQSFVKSAAFEDNVVKATKKAQQKRKL